MTEDVQLAAVKQSVYAIRYITDANIIPGQVVKDAHYIRWEI